MNREKLMALKLRLDSSQKRGGLYFRPKPGATHTIRILQRPNVEEFYLPFYQHSNIGTEKVPILCRRTIHATDCPIDEVAQELMRSTDEKEKRLGKGMLAQERYAFVVLVDGDPKPLCWDLAPKFFRKIVGFVCDPAWGDILDPYEGRDWTMERGPGQGIDTEYDFRPSPEKTSIGATQEEIEAILADLPDLTRAYCPKEPDEIMAILDGGADSFSPADMGAAPPPLPPPAPSTPPPPPRVVRPPASPAPPAPVAPVAPPVEAPKPPLPPVASPTASGPAAPPAVPQVPTEKLSEAKRKFQEKMAALKKGK